MGRPVVHWELWSKDPDRLAAFYTAALDWQVQAMPEIGYHMVSTGSEQGIGGGIMRPQDGPWPGNMTIYAEVDALAPALARVVAAGGRVVVERMEIPGAGALALFADPDERVIGLWERRPPPATP